MSESKLLKIIDDFFKAIYCIEAFPYPLNHKTVNIHSLNEIKMKENEYSPTLSCLDLRVDFENPRFVDVSLNIFRLVRPMFLIFLLA